MRASAKSGTHPASRHAGVVPRLLVLGTLALASCSAGAPPAASPQATAGTALAVAENCNGSPELQALWQQRMTQPGGRSQPVGPGDVLRVSVVGIQELQNEDVQVSDSGTITLPFVGTIAVAGMNLDAVEQTLDERFAEYIKSPEVHIVMQTDRSQTVAVMGLVSKPMLVPLTMPNETIMDVIGAAGGLSGDASQRVLFIPSAAQAQAAAPAVIQASADPPAASLAGVGKVTPIVVDLHSNTEQGCLDLPVRAGDTIVVPPAGNVMVGGWVERPGEIQITPGMTVLGAITASGGALYSSNVVVLRVNGQGNRASIPVNLAAVKNGKEADVPLEAGDVVMVQGSALGALPYAFHELFTGLGAGIPIPIP